MNPLKNAGYELVLIIFMFLVLMGGYLFIIANALMTYSMR